MTLAEVLTEPVLETRILTAAVTAIAEREAAELKAKTELAASMQRWIDKLNAAKARLDAAKKKA